MTLKAHVKGKSPEDERLEWISDIDIRVDEDRIHLGGCDGFVSIKLYDIDLPPGADERHFEDGHEVLTDIVADEIYQLDERGREFELKGGDDEC